MSANRHARRAQIAAVKKQLRLEQLCLVRGHDVDDVWVMRPAWVGAGIVIPKVHFDRRCRRCGALDSTWREILGETKPQAEPMVLAAWLLANDATVEAPAGEIRMPNTDELANLAAKAGIGGDAANDAVNAAEARPN